MGADVQHVCNFMSKSAYQFVIQNRQIKFLVGLCQADSTVLRFLFDMLDRNVLAELMNQCDT